MFCLPETLQTHLGAQGNQPFHQVKRLPCQSAHHTPVCLWNLARIADMPGSSMTSHVIYLHKLLKIRRQDMVPDTEVLTKASIPSMHTLRSGGQDMWQECLMIACQNSCCLVSPVRASAQLEDKRSAWMTPWNYPWKALTLGSPLERPPLVIAPHGAAVSWCESIHAVWMRCRSGSGNSKNHEHRKYECLIPLCSAVVEQYAAALQMFSHTMEWFVPLPQGLCSRNWVWSAFLPIFLLKFLNSYQQILKFPRASNHDEVRVQKTELKLYEDVVNGKHRVQTFVSWYCATKSVAFF